RTVWPGGFASPSPAERFAALLERRPAGIAVAELPILLGLPADEAASVARAEQGARLVGGLWASETTLRDIGTHALAALRAYHRGHPSDRGMPLETPRRGRGACVGRPRRGRADAGQRRGGGAVRVRAPG